MNTPQKKTPKPLSVETIAKRERLLAQRVTVLENTVFALSETVRKLKETVDKKNGCMIWEPSTRKRSK